MRILHIVHENPLAFRGGLQVYARQLAELQASSGHEVTLFALDEADDTQPYTECLENGVRYVLVNRKALRKKRFRFFDSFRNQQVAALFKQIFRDEKIDVAHVHHLLLLSGDIVHFLRARNVALVATLHDYWYLCHRIKLLYRDCNECTGPDGGRKCYSCGDERYSRFPGRLLYPVLYWSYIYRTNYLRGVMGAFDRILAPSQMLRQVYMDNGLPGHRVVYSLLGIRPVLHQYAYEEKEMRTFGYLGAIQPEKGLEYLVRAFNELEGRPVHLKIYGSGKIKFLEQLKTLASNPEIEFAGTYPNEKLPEVMAELDAVVLPSIWKENSPVILHEALAAGMPVLASRIGGIPELIADGKNGILFDPRDVPAIRRAVQKMLVRPELFRQLSENSGMAKSFEENAAELEQIYTDILHSRSLCD